MINIPMVTRSSFGGRSWADRRDEWPSLYSFKVIKASIVS